MEALSEVRKAHLEFRHLDDELMHWVSALAEQKPIHSRVRMAGILLEHVNRDIDRHPNALNKFECNDPETCCKNALKLIGDHGTGWERITSIVSRKLGKPQSITDLLSDRIQQNPG